METFPVAGVKMIILETRTTVRCPLGGKDKVRVKVTYQPRDLALEARSFRHWFKGRKAFAEVLAGELYAEITRVAHPCSVHVEVGHSTERVRLQVIA